MYPLLRAASAVAATTMTALAVSAMAPAHAAPYLSMSSHINVHPVPGTNNGTYYDQHVIDIDGVVVMSQAAAQDTIDHGYTIALRYWGDDPSSDDLLYGPVKPRTVFAAADGLHFQHYVTLPHFLMNEDDAVSDFLDDGEDEIYVGARLLDPAGNTVTSAESNRLLDNY